MHAHINQHKTYSQHEQTASARSVYISAGKAHMVVRLFSDPRTQNQHRHGTKILSPSSVNYYGRSYLNVSSRLLCRIALTIPHHTTLHRTAPHRTAPHRTAPHRTAPHRTTPHHTTPRHTTPHLLHTTTPTLPHLHHITRHHTSPHRTTPHHTTPNLTIQNLY